MKLIGGHLHQEYFSYKKISINFQADCVTELELSTLQQAVVLEVAFGLGCFIATVLMNRFSKFSILCKLNAP